MKVLPLIFRNDAVATLRLKVWDRHSCSSHVLSPQHPASLTSYLIHRFEMILQAIHDLSTTGRIDALWCGSDRL